MPLYIYIDDTRKPIFTDCIWAKNYEEATTAVENNGGNNHLILDFDHDLGSNKTGYDLAKWLVANQYTGDFRVHSMYPAGHKNISDLLTQYGWREFY